MKLRDVWKKMYDALMMGISHMIPVLVAGGILMAIGTAIVAPANIAEVESGFAKLIHTWGSTLFYAMNIVLAIYTAYAIGNRAAITAGLAAGLLADLGGSGFIGAVIGGWAAGGLVLLIRRIKLPQAMASVMPILIIPLLSTIGVCVVMELLGPPLSWLLSAITAFLDWLQGIAPWLLGAGIGAMLAAGMGGPPGRAVVPFAIAAASVGNWMPFTAMSIGGMSSCFGIALAIIIAKQKFTQQERSSMSGLLIGGVCLITEFCIPYALRDPKRIFPACFLGGAVGGGLAMLLGVSCPAAHGGMFVIPLANKPLLYLLCMAAQALVTCGYLLIFKKNLSPELSGIDPGTADAVA